MPPARSQGIMRVSRSRRRMRGGSFMSFLRKANRFLRRTKAISRIGNVLGRAGVPYASNIGRVAGVMGYGRRRRRTFRRTRMGRRVRGGSLKLPGQGLGTPGGAYTIRHSRMPSRRSQHLTPLPMNY